MPNTSNDTVKYGSIDRTEINEDCQDVKENRNYFNHAANDDFSNPTESQRSQSSSNNQNRRFLIFGLSLAFATFVILTLPTSSSRAHNNSSIRTISTSATMSLTGVSNADASDAATDAATVTENEESLPVDSWYSPFFEHVLEWKEIPLEEAPTDYDHNYNNTGSTSNVGSNHYRASIEFCSDPATNLYGYGPVGECVPGKAAPLIRIQPKRFYHLTLYNNAHIDTNVHTHGLHVSGVGTVDDVTRVAKPGECLTYDYYILDDADVGTFWYHPHRHPLVTRSAYGGSYGMLIVDETTAIEEDRFYPDHLVNFLTQNEILLQFSSMYNKKLKNAFRSNKVNGQDHLDLYLEEDAYYYFRISSVVYAESVNYVEFDPPDVCDVRVIAYDGVYRSKIPGSVSSHKHMMSVSSRGDFSVSCSESVDIHFHQGKPSKASKMVRVHVVKSSEEKSLPQSNDDPSQVFLPATLPSSPYWNRNKETRWKPRRPYYMPDLSDPTNLVDEYWSVSMDDYFVNGTKGVSVNQHVWDPNESIRTFDLGQLVEYPINLSQQHPYHAHINRMQVVEPGGCGGRFEEGEYYDTIVQAEDKPGNCTIRTKFFDFAGRIVIHCHRFSHEDQGMMTWIDILGGHGHGMKAAPATSCAAVL